MGKKRSSRGIRLDVKSGAECASGPPACGPNAQKSQILTTIAKSNSLETLSGDLEYESPLEKLMLKATDEQSAKIFAQAWNSDISEKLALRQANLNVSYDEFEKLISSKKLDANVKKCTAFVRKIRQYTESQKTSIESDIKTLNLSKYLTEISSAITEARFKIENIHDVVEICSWVHQRYSEFSPLLYDSLKKAFPTKKSDMTAAVLSKLSVDLRMIGELVVCGVISTNEGCHMLNVILRSMISMDKEGVQCLIPIISFSLGMSDPFLGEIPRTISNLCLEHGISLNQTNALPEDKKRIFKNLIIDYFNIVCSALLKCHHEKQKSELYNRKLLRTKGEITPERKEDHLGIKNKFDKYKATVTRFADAINENLPELTSLPVDPDEEEEDAMLRTESGELLTVVPGIVIFEDEETRSFYQDFKDLKVYLPPVAYRESIQQTAAQTLAIEEREKALDDFDDEEEAAELENEEISMEEDASADPEAETELPPSMRNETEEKEIDKQIKPNFQAFLNQLPNCVNRNMIDKAAFEFAETHNNRPNRKKLVQTLFRVPRQRMDMLPFYSRFVAIINPVMPDVGLELCQLLKNDFRFLVRKKHQIFIETKVKVVRFIGELVNFRIFPKSDALQCFKILLMDFVHHQIEMACVFVESCGRLLYRTPDSHRRMKIYLEEMIRKKTVKSLEPRYISMIDHVYTIVLPRDDTPRIEKKRPALEIYLGPSMMEELSKKTLAEATEMIVSVNWKDDNEANIALKMLSSPWKITAQQIRVQAEVLSNLLKAEPYVVTRVIDLVIEDIRRGLENPYVDYNHRRYSTLQYLSEMYYYRLLKSDSMFDVLYLLITFGVSWDNSKPSTCDPPDNLSRIRYACYLLKESGDFINHGSNKKRMKLFLVHLQRYYWFKRSHPMWDQRKFPYGIFEMWEENAKRLYPKITLAKDSDEAQTILTDMETGVVKGRSDATKFMKITPVSESIDIQAIAEEIEQTGKMSKRGTSQPPGNRKPNQSGRSSSLPHRPEKIRRDLAFINPLDMDMDEAIDPYEGSQNGDTKPLHPEDEEFIGMFEKMCSEVNYTAVRDGGKHMKTDIAIPLHISNSAHSTSSSFQIVADKEKPIDQSGDFVPFTLITRKGNKQQYKTLPLPADSDFVQRIRSREDMEREEKESVKKRTLAISQLQEAEERERERASIKAFVVPKDHRQHKV